MRDGKLVVAPAGLVIEPTQVGVDVCHGGIASKALQPLPVPSQADSAQPRGESASRSRSVPPTATTVGNAAGTSGPKLGPENAKLKSPAPATTATLGCT